MGAFSTAVGAVANVLIIAFLGLFLAWDPEAYAGPLLLLVPEENGRQRTRGVLRAVVGALESWLLARILSMAVVGVLTVAALLVAGVPLALALGLIAGGLSFIPFIGPLMASVPAILVGLGESSGTALAVAAIYATVQAVESYLVTPVIEHKMVSLPPALILTSQAVMGLLFGVVGLLVATPVALTLVVLVQTLYLEDQLDEDISPAGN
jgi:predicted PurR-regulated permease PerM